MPTISSTPEQLFPSIMNHVLNKKGARRKRGLGGQTYNEKKLSRINRKNDIPLSLERTNFFNWIEQLQLKLGLNDYNFAKTLYVTTQTVRLWKRRAGHYPSQRSFLLLLKLERQTRLKEEDVYFVVRIRS